MNDYFLAMAVAILLSAAKESVKNPQKKVELKKVMLKIRNSINNLYADDPDFNEGPTLFQPPPTP